MKGLGNKHVWNFEVRKIITFRLSGIKVIQKLALIDGNRHTRMNPIFRVDLMFSLLFLYFRENLYQGPAFGYARE